MFMQKIDLPRVTCDLFGVKSGFYGSGNGSSITGDKPRAAAEDEARAYADFLRRKCGLPEIGKPHLHHTGYCRGQAPGAHFHYVGATFGAAIQGPTRDAATGVAIPAQYEPGAFSVLFPGANTMRATVTLETLDDAGEVVSSQTMPVEPKKGGVVWSKDDVGKAAGPVAKPEKAKRTPTVAKRRAAPTVDKRRRAILLALKLRAELRRMRAEARQMPEDCAAPASAPDAPATARDAILSDLTAAQALMRGATYKAPHPLSMREAFAALYRMARRDKLAGADLLHAACDLTGEPHETFKCWRACQLHRAVTRALETPEAMREKLARQVLNCWGHGNPFRSPAMESPRFAAWRANVARADALRKRLADAGRLEYDAGNWVVRVLPLPVTPKPAPTAIHNSRPLAGMFRACSGQGKGKRTWGICLARDRVLPWWRHEGENGRPRLYSSFEAAQREIAKLERGPMPGILAAELAKQAAARAANPANIKTDWHSPAGLTCDQCAIEGRAAPEYPGPVIRVRITLPGYDGQEARVVPWHSGGWHMLTDSGMRVTFYAEQEGKAWERLPGATADEPEATPTSGQAKRTPAHERAIRRAWAERCARREAEADAVMWARVAEIRQGKRKAAVSKAMRLSRDLATAKQQAIGWQIRFEQERESLQAEVRAGDDRARLAESIAEDHMRMREDLQRVLADAEARLAAAEAENAQLWAEIEALTAPQPALAA